MKKINKELEPILKAQWIEEKAICYINRARSGSRRAIWKWDIANSKLEKKDIEGID